MNVSPQEYTRRLKCILIVAAVARGAVILAAEFSPQRFDFPDSHRYARVAWHVALGHGPVELPNVLAGTDPIYPGILSIARFCGAESDEAVFRFGRVFNGIVGVVCVAVLAALGRTLIGDTAALWAAGLLAVDPISIFFTALVLTETLYTAYLLAAILKIARMTEGRWIAGAAVAGMMFAFGALTRSTGVFLVLFMLPAAWMFTPRGGRRFLAVLVMIYSAGLVHLPVIARNGQILDAFVPVRTGSGPALLEAFGPWADGGAGMDRIVYPPIPPDASECMKDAICRRAAWDWIRAHPWESIALAGRKFARTWSPWLHAPGHSTIAYQAVSLLTVIPAFLLALAGVWLLRRVNEGASTGLIDTHAPPRHVLFLLLTPIAYFTLVHMVLIGSVRYRVPVMPLVFLLGGVSLTALMNRIRGRRTAGQGG